MAFARVSCPALFQAPLGRGIATVLGPQGLRLTGLTSFHLDEGPDFAWLNIYRTLADGRQLEITRERTPDHVAIEGDSVAVRWAACPAVQAELQAHYRIAGPDSLDATFSARLAADYRRFELFIANYFTPHYTPYFPVQDDRTHPEGVTWYQKQWYGRNEAESWARDEDAEAVFRDGRWLDGYPLNWRRGPYYAHALTLQEHRYGHAILLMARPADCLGLSGYNSYHNAQYFHLGGDDVQAGQHLTFTIRLVLLTEWDDLPAEALTRYHQWLEE